MKLSSFFIHTSLAFNAIALPNGQYISAKDNHDYVNEAHHVARRSINNDSLVVKLHDSNYLEIRKEINDPEHKHLNVEDEEQRKKDRDRKLLAGLLVPFLGGPALAIGAGVAGKYGGKYGRKKWDEQKIKKAQKIKDRIGERARHRITEIREKNIANRDEWIQTQTQIEQYTRILHELHVHEEDEQFRGYLGEVLKNLTTRACQLHWPVPEGDKWAKEAEDVRNLAFPGWYDELALDQALASDLPKFDPNQNMDYPPYPETDIPDEPWERQHYPSMRGYDVRYRNGHYNLQGWTDPADAASETSTDRYHGYMDPFDGQKADPWTGQRIKFPPPEPPAIVAREVVVDENCSKDPAQKAAEKVAESAPAALLALISGGVPELTSLIVAVITARTPLAAVDAASALYTAAPAAVALAVPVVYAIGSPVAATVLISDTHVPGGLPAFAKILSAVLTATPETTSQETIAVFEKGPEAAVLASFALSSAAFYVPWCTDAEAKFNALRDASIFLAAAAVTTEDPTMAVEHAETYLQAGYPQVARAMSLASIHAVGARPDDPIDRPTAEGLKYAGDVLDMTYVVEPEPERPTFARPASVDVQAPSIPDVSVLLSHGLPSISWIPRFSSETVPHLWYGPSRFHGSPVAAKTSKSAVASASVASNVTASLISASSMSMSSRMSVASASANSPSSMLAVASRLNASSMYASSMYASSMSAASISASAKLATASRLSASTTFATATSKTLFNASTASLTLNTAPFTTTDSVLSISTSTPFPSAGSGTNSSISLVSILSPALYEFSEAIVPIIVQAEGTASHWQHQLDEAFTRSLVTHTSRHHIGGCKNHIVYHIHGGNTHKWHDDVQGLECLERTFLLPQFVDPINVAYLGEKGKQKGFMYCYVDSGTFELQGDMGFVNWAVAGEYKRFNDKGDKENEHGHVVKFRRLKEDCGSVLPVMNKRGQQQPRLLKSRNIIEIVPENGHEWNKEQEGMIRDRTEGKWFNATSPQQEVLLWLSDTVHKKAGFAIEADRGIVKGGPEDFVV